MDANGIISSYEISLTMISNAVPIMTKHEATTVVVFSDLMPFTNYTATVHPLTGMDC